MISNTVQTDLGQAVAHKTVSMPHNLIEAGLTGIVKPDQLFTREMPCGGVLLVAGGTNGEETRLASQIAARALDASQRVAYISTRYDQNDHIDLIASSGMTWPYDKKLDEHLDFHLRADFRDAPVDILNEILERIEVPTCLILDQLQITGVFGSGATRRFVDQEKLATSVMKRLAAYAHEHSIPVVVLCQQKPDALSSTRKRITRSQIAEFPLIGNFCDVFIGISELRSSAVNAEEGSYATAQYFNMIGSGEADLIPVTADIHNYRFVARDAEGVALDPEVRLRAAKKVIDSKHGGYRMFRRDVFEQLCQLGDPDCINVYCMFLLVVETMDVGKYGTVSYGKDRLGEILGVNRKRVAAVIKKLIKAGLIRETGKKNGRSRIYQIIDFSESQDPGVPGFFMLANNLRDPARKDLLGDSVLLRVWLGLIHAAKFSRDSEFLERGQLLRNSHELAYKLGDSPEVVDGVIEQLLQEGRIKNVNLDFYDIEVLEIVNYEIYQSGKLYSRDFAEKNLTESICQTRAK